MSKDKMMCEIQRLQFAAVELNLYLDNFPGNEEAREDYAEISCKLDKAIYDYEKRYGTLRNFGAAYIEDSCSWTKDPWPWGN